VSAAFDQSLIQGNILKGYRRARVRHIVLAVADRAAARRWLGASVSGDTEKAPQITSGAPWASKPDVCFNIGVTFEGLRALGVSPVSLQSFPLEFSVGMHQRAVKLGDVGTSAPACWPSPFDQPERIHLIASVYSDHEGHLDEVQNSLAATGKLGAFQILGIRDGWAFNGDFVHFGYRDGISHPRFEGIHDSQNHRDLQPRTPLGTVLLGYPTVFEGLVWQVPQPSELGMLGSFNAFRVLAQDVAGFEAFLDRAATELMAHSLTHELLPVDAEASYGQGVTRHAALRELIAAKMCGRWRNGTPLDLAPDQPGAVDARILNDFDYSGETACPYGAHTRRSNPRGATIVQRGANHSRRLVRRGMPYGPAYDPANPADGVERGLLGNFLGANLGAQFEALSCDWLNLGLQDPRITGSNDPLLGANDPLTSWFDIPLRSGASIRLTGLPRFVQTRGGAYTFLPSMAAIRYLATLAD
jgi:deferrochelatase/peroxidase EfeB